MRDPRCDAMVHFRITYDYKKIMMFAAMLFIFINYCKFIGKHCWRSNDDDEEEEETDGEKN